MLINVDWDFSTNDVNVFLYTRPRPVFGRLSLEMDRREGKVLMGKPLRTWSNICAGWEYEMPHDWRGAPNDLSANMLRDWHRASNELSAKTLCDRRLTLGVKWLFRKKRYVTDRGPRMTSQQNRYVIDMGPKWPSAKTLAAYCKKQFCVIRPFCTKSVRYN